MKTKGEFTSPYADAIQFLENNKNLMTCHLKEIHGEFEKTIYDEWEAQHSKKGKKKDAEAGKDGKKTGVAGKKKVVKFNKYQKNMECLETLFHKGWITKIKYYEDLCNIVSSSLDGMIHIHKIENLKYKNLTFNLHQKGVNSFVYCKTPM